MSSFLDRWLYRDTSSHNMGLKNGNTGSAYTRTSSLGSQPYYPEDDKKSPQSYSHMHAPQLEKTTPNLRNVPWSYYAELESQRRGSASSTTSSESASSI
jgi:hypothetical protein